jgi:hypothetical protein
MGSKEARIMRKVVLCLALALAFATLATPVLIWWGGGTVGPPC